MPRLDMGSRVGVMADPGRCLIHPAAPEDVPTILGLIRGLAEYERMSDQVVATESLVRAALFPAEGAPAAHCVLAHIGTTPIGFALYFFNFSTFLGRPGLYLEDLFVQPDFRGRGIGKMLLLHLARLANARGCGRMEWSVLDWNESAIAFYESIGATRLHEWRICRLSGEALERYR